MSFAFSVLRRGAVFVLPALLLAARPGSCHAQASSSPSPDAADSRTAEATVPRADRAASPSAEATRTLPLAGPLAQANAEVSGLAWHAGDLLLLPQYPFRMSGRADYGLIYALSKERIEAFLSGKRDGPLRPRPVPLRAPELRKRSPTYEGCEALAFWKGRAYLATEAVADAGTGAMHGFLFSGRLRGDTLRLNGRRRATLPPQTEAVNMAYEALLATPHRVLALYEANGRNVNVRPRAAALSPTLRLLRTLPFPALEYRLTDATALDAEGRFWVMNYFFPGEREKLNPAVDSLAEAGSNALRGPVERLVEFRLGKDGFERTPAAPLHLATRPKTPRNWEGVARFHSEARGPGFLLVTDQYPGTVLAFVAAGKQAE